MRQIFFHWWQRESLAADATRQITALQTIGGFLNEESARWLVTFLAHPNDAVYLAAKRALLDMGPVAVPALIAALTAADVEVREVAAECLGKLADRRAVPALLGSVNDPAPSVRLCVNHALRVFGCLTPADGHPRPRPVPTQNLVTTPYAGSVAQPTEGV